MNYALVSKEQLTQKGITNFGEELKDGRVVLPVSALKTITGLTGVEIVSLSEVKKLLKK